MIRISLVLLFTLCFSTSTLAAPFSFVFTSTGMSYNSLPAPASAGDVLEITVVLDNGGSSPLSQSWGYSDIVSITFSLDGGNYTFGIPQSTFVDVSTTGTLNTDANGVVIGATMDWSADSTAGHLDSNGSALESWYITGSNDLVYYDPCCNPTIGAAHSTNDISRWRLARPETNVPTMPLFGLGLTVVGLLVLARRRMVF